MNCVKKVLFLIFLPFFYSVIFAQTASAGLFSAGESRTAEEGFAAQEFRRGVQAFYRGSYNDAVMQFEKALSYLPEDNLILDWLGKAYYRSGMEGTALQSWTRASNSGYGGLLLQNRIEIVRERRILPEFTDEQVRYSEAGVFSGNLNGNFIFSGPISVLPNNNGTCWILSYGSNDLVLMDINGTVLNRITGPINGFDRPIDIIRLDDGKLLVSESAGDRLALFSAKGKFQKYFGSKGRDVGQLVGPQYIAQDSRGNIYVSDYGNSRISVFDKEGNGLFVFGNKSEKDFEGLKGPTGIAALGEFIFVADDVRGCIYQFDQAGNFLRILCEKQTFKHPESMKVWGKYLVVCDSNRIVTVDTDSGSLYTNVSTGNAPDRLTSAVPDVNGNILVTDVKSNEVYVMTKVSELVGGLFVQVDRIDSSKFPEVRLDIKVENRHRNPVVGLKENNFYITEDKRPVSKFKFLGASSKTDYVDVTLVIDRSSYTVENSEQVDIAVREIAKSMNGKGTLRIVSAGKMPVIEYKGNPNGAKNFSSEGLKNPISDSVALDLALRLSANDLINAGMKKAVVVISAGKVGLSAFDKYSLTDIVSYFNNNSISCSAVKVVQGASDEEFNYIVDRTSGKEYYVFRPEGLSSILEELLDIPTGVYSFSFVSVMNTNFGEKFLPIEVEAYLMNRSGRDETGYFAPLE